MRTSPVNRNRFVYSLLLAAVGAGCIRRAEQSSGAGAAPGAAERPSSGGNNLLKASSFDDGKSVPWTTSFTAPADGSAEVKDGALCVEVKHVGNNPWDAQLRHREMTIERGHTYTVAFKAYASAPTKARPKVGMAGPPYGEYWSATIDVDTEPRQYVGRFTMAQGDDSGAEFSFHIGGAMAKASAPFTFCIDDIRLDDPRFAAPAVEGGAPLADLLVNQTGYLPARAKVATLRSASTKPVAWQLLDSGGSVVKSGESTVFGADAASGDHVHQLDFSAFSRPGTGYTLRAGEQVSHAFDIAPDLYSQLKIDALAYFYQNRSGVAIEERFVPDPKLARPAGHVADKKVGCAPKSGCGYTLDVSGGWYDAGDHGKYVVNGGIALWTLQNQYERARALGATRAAPADGELSIPERGNGVPDILDEARWQLEFMLKMQVPEGQPLAGMAHHKLHDQSWTALATAPHEDGQPRYLFPPSTAATLNLAATAAQGARVWKGLDDAFARRCLRAAERAFAAARKHPARLARKGGEGGGAYDDKDVEDEFYWALAELYVTTGKAEYERALKRSPLDRRFPLSAGGHQSSFNWGTTDALGMISMAVVPGENPARAKVVQQRIVQAAKTLLETQRAEGYGTLLKPAGGKYEWGSNSFVLNNMIVLGLAFDFSKDPRFLDGMVQGMDYLLGRNPLDQSYVTGYGERPLKNPHHRFWAHQVDSRYPLAPEGAVSGGPNSSLQDPYAQAAGLKGCKPSRCFVDHIEAWSVNEITINWNAPLSWVAGYLDDKGGH